VQEVFAVAAQSYEDGNPLLVVEREETAALMPVLGGLDVLDLGAGCGHYARLATALDARSALALDVTEEMVRRAPERAVVGDAGHLPLRGESFDVVIAALVISYVSDRQAVFAEVARVLRPQGALVLSDLHPVARRLGWSRSFPGASEASVRIEAPPPTLAELASDMSRAGLSLELTREAAIDDRLRAEFQRAGRRDFEALRGTPLLVMARARKGGPHVS
jgi:ubiquinone/menaquinone biosynthesis C-methylase UbiE